MISIRDKAVLIRYKNDFDSSQRMTDKDLRNVMVLFLFEGVLCHIKSNCTLTKMLK